MVGDIYCSVAFLLAAVCCQAQSVFPDSSYNNSHYRQRIEFFNALKVPRKAVVFLGNSITEAGPWSEMLPGKRVINRGISGDVSYGVVARIDAVLATNPAKIFLLIGINDLKRGTPIECIVSNYERIIQRVKAHSFHTKLYLQSVLPVAEKMLPAIYSKINNQLIDELNERMQTLAKKYHCAYVNLHTVDFMDKDGQLKTELTIDGLHLKPPAYLLWARLLERNKYL
jgi:lysophospholipase L1-like esterase